MKNYGREERGGTANAAKNIAYSLQTIHRVAKTYIMHVKFCDSCSTDFWVEITKHAHKLYPQIGTNPGSLTCLARAVPLCNRWFSPWPLLMLMEVSTIRVRRWCDTPDEHIARAWIVRTFTNTSKGRWKLSVVVHPHSKRKVADLSPSADKLFIGQKDITTLVWARLYLAQYNAHISSQNEYQYPHH